MSIPRFDNTQAMAEGWGISHCLGSKDGPWQLQKIDEQEVFEKDDEAWSFVLWKVAEGSEYHIAAIQFLQDHCPAEFDRLVDHCGFLGLETSFNPPPVTRNSTQSQLDAIEIADPYLTDRQRDEVNTAMAFITEDLEA